jgi:hypothetical protein
MSDLLLFLVEFAGALACFVVVLGMLGLLILGTNED